MSPLAPSQGKATEPDWDLDTAATWVPLPEHTPSPQFVSHPLWGLLLHIHPAGGLRVSAYFLPEASTARLELCD